jgi:Fungal Zn(2)-Cys(6) binuclear cluster domain
MIAQHSAPDQARPVSMPPEPAPEQYGRKYRSKKQRPCDLCRSRKTHCRLLRSEATCELCKKLERRCTFLDAPSRRPLNPRPDGRTDHPQPDVGQPTDLGLARGHAHIPILSHGDANGPTIGHAHFWPLQPVQDQAFSLEAAPQLDWTAVGFPSFG